jgi:hypothetical protein
VNDFALAILRPGASAPADTRLVALRADVDSAVFRVCRCRAPPDFLLSASDLTVRSTRRPPTAPTSTSPLSRASLDVPGSSSTSISTPRWSSQRHRHREIAAFFSVTGDFALTKSDRTDVVVTDGTTPTTLAKAVLLTFGASTSPASWA